MTTPSLALGTVQFGLAYGIAGRASPVPDGDARAILARAWELGVRRLDTAPAYGDIEERLAGLAGDRDFSIVSKIAAPPAGADRAEHARASVAASRARLGERLAGLLFHAAEDLTGPDAAAAWEAAEGAGLPLGPSCYDAATLRTIADAFPVAMAQVPGSALDQSVSGLALDRPVELTLRSIFLQGLLLWPPEAVAAEVPAAVEPVRRFRRFCEERDLPPLECALGVARALPGVAYCVVGVDSIAQLEEVAAAWDRAPAIGAPSLDTPDPDVIDPRRWNRTAHA